MKHVKIITLLIFVLFSLSFVYADSYIYTPKVYDFTNDANLNTTLWLNQTLKRIGTSVATITENTQNITSNTQGGGLANLTSLQFLNYTNMNNITFKTGLYAQVNTACFYAYSEFYIFGVLISSVTQPAGCSGTNTEFATWRLEQNGSIKNGLNFIVYKNGVYNKTITPTANYLFMRSDSDQNVASIPTRSTSRFDLENITYLETDYLEVNLTAPLTDYTITEDSTTFNASFYSAPSNLTNATLLVWYLNGTVYKSNYTNLSGNINSTSRSITFDDGGGYVWNYYVCSTSQCTMQDNNRSFIFGYKLNNITYSPTVYDLSYTNFSLNITINPSIVSFVTATLYYGGTAYSSTQTQNGNEFYFYREFAVPSVTSSQNKSFYWSIFLSDTTISDTFNTSTYNQTVNPITFQRCGTPPVAVNYTILDESTLTPITATFSGNFLYSLDASFTPKSYSNSSGGLASYTFCINNNETYLVDATIDLTKTDYTSRQYNLFNEQYTNTTTTRFLYLLNNSVSSDVVIQLKDEGQQILSGYGAKIYRFYPSTGNYTLVEQKQTDAFGEFVLRAELNTVKYKIEFYDTNNELVETREPVYFICYTTVCNIPFIIRNDNDVLNIFDDIDGYTYNLNFNNASNTWVFAWTDTTNSSGLINRLYVFQPNANGTTVTVCNVTSSSTSSALNCAVGTGGGAYIAQAFRYTTSGGEILIDIEGALVDSIAETLGVNGWFWYFLIAMLGMTIFIFSPVAGMIAFIGITILAVFAGLIYLSPMALIGLIAIGGFFIWAFR